MPPDDPKFTAIVKALVLAAGYTEEEWHTTNAGAWVEPYRKAAREALAAVPRVVRVSAEQARDFALALSL